MDNEFNIEAFFQSTAKTITVGIIRDIEYNKSKIGEGLSNIDIQKLHESIFNGVYTGLVMSDEFENEKVKNFCGYMESMCPPYLKKAVLITEADVFYKNNPDIEESFCDKNCETCDKKELHQPTDNTLINQTGMPIKMNIYDMDSFLNFMPFLLEDVVKQLHGKIKFVGFKQDGTVMVFSYESVKGEKLSVVGEPNKPALDWMANLTQENGQLTITTLKKALGLLKIKFGYSE